MSDPYRFLSSLGQAHLIHSISILCDDDEDLLRFLFSRRQQALRLPARNLLAEATCFALPEQLLVRTALDFWNRRGAARLSELLNTWEPEHWIRFVRAICYLEEIGVDVRDALITDLGEPDSRLGAPSRRPNRKTEARLP